MLPGDRIRMLSLALLLATTARAEQAAEQPLLVDRFDRNHSTIGFTVPILGGLSEVEGKFTDFSLALQYDAADLSRSSVAASIEVASIDTGVADRDTHLRSEDFFDAARFPQLRFVSTTIEKRGEGWLARGNLTMRGVTKPIELPFTLKVQKEGSEAFLIALSADLEIDRDDWGISWRHDIEAFVSDRVKIRLRLLSRLLPPTAPASRSQARVHSLEAIEAVAVLEVFGEQHPGIVSLVRRR